MWSGCRKPVLEQLVYKGTLKDYVVTVQIFFLQHESLNEVWKMTYPPSILGKTMQVLVLKINLMHELLRNTSLKLVQCKSLVFRLIILAVRDLVFAKTPRSFGFMKSTKNYIKSNLISKTTHCNISHESLLF